MMRDYLNENFSRIPNLVYHTMNKCDDFIVIYGGKRTVNDFSGNLYLLKISKNKFVCADYEENFNCNS